jgi:hypothetical protein
VLRYAKVRHAETTTYDNIPYDELPIEEVDWRLRADHIRRRSQRKNSPKEVDIEPEWATEAALDSRKMVGDSGSRNGESVQVIGYSSTCKRVLTVLLVPDEHPPRGRWHGATAYVANARERAAYESRGDEND